MSDVPQGPDWWIASDGKWYPPESHPGYQPPPTPPAAPGWPSQPSSLTGPPWSVPPVTPSAMPLHLWVLDPPPSPRDRFTCAIRLIMVIPQAIVLFFVEIAAFFAVIAAWFVALVTGRLTDGLRDFIAGTLRWSLRVEGYLFFLTDKYPPYSLGDEPTYPMRLAIPPPVQLNRAAVLFRVFIAIPGWIVTSVVSAGLLVVSFGSWVAVLVTGRLPVPLFEATRAVLRYEARFYAYFSMVTPEYPWGVMGDTSFLPAGTDPYEDWSIKLSSGGRTAMIVVIVLGVISDVVNNRGRL
jgi:Domain of unknown function (DUF4389)